MDKKLGKYKICKECGKRVYLSDPYGWKHASDGNGEIDYDRVVHVDCYYE